MGGWRDGNISTGNPVVDELLQRAKDIPRSLAVFSPKRLLIDWTLRPKHWRHVWIDEACGIPDSEWLRCAERLSPASRGRMFSLWLLIVSTRYLRHDSPPDWETITARAGQVFGLSLAEVQHDVREVMRLREEIAACSHQRHRAEEELTRREATTAARQLVAALDDDDDDDAL